MCPSCAIRAKRCVAHALYAGAYEEYFSEGQSHFPDFFPGVKCFYPVENSHFGRKKKLVSSFCTFVTFPPSIFNFPPSFFPFSFFSAPFSLFSLPLFSLYVSRNFSVRSLWGTLCLPAPPPRLLHHWLYEHALPSHIYSTF